MTETSAPPRDDAPWRLEVVAGPNAGAVVPLGPGSIRIGTAESNDVVLAGANPDHAVLQVQPDGRLRMTALAPIQLGRRTVRAGHAHELRDGSAVRMGENEVRLIRAALPRPRPWLWAAAAGVPAVLLLVALFAPWGRGAAEAVAASAAPVSTAPSTTPDVAGELRQRLADAGLGSALAVRGAAGAIVVEGALSPAQASIWREVRTWYDSRFAAGPALVPRIGVGAPSAPGAPELRVRAIALAPVPYVIAADGARFTEGAVLPGGWTIARIAPSQVVLTRGGQTSVLSF